MVGDIKLSRNLDEAFSKKFLVASGAAASINNGEPTKAGSQASSQGFPAAIMVDADGTTTQRFFGIAKTVSTDTVAAAGEVYTWLPLPGLIYEAKAKTASLANTQALIDGLIGKRVIFDLTSTVWTVDTAAADGATNCVVCVGGEYQSNIIHFVYSTDGTFFT